LRRVSYLSFEQISRREIAAVECSADGNILEIRSNEAALKKIPRHETAMQFDARKITIVERA
jgi:hypothetical protein